MTTITVQAATLSRSFSPRGSRLFANLALRLLSWFQAPTDDEVRSRAEEAEVVRVLARRVQATDPGYAADLFAAAARHELKGD